VGRSLFDEFGTNHILAHPAMWQETSDKAEIREASGSLPYLVRRASSFGHLGLLATAQNFPPVVSETYLRTLLFAGFEFQRSFISKACPGVRRNQFRNQPYLYRRDKANAGPCRSLRWWQPHLLPSLLLAILTTGRRVGAAWLNQEAYEWGDGVTASNEV
jgi:hypothetical protein